MRDQILKVLIPLAAWGLNLAVPAIPAFVWSGLLSAILNGDITLEHIAAFMAAHGIKTYHERQDFPGGVSGQPDTAGPDLSPGTTNTNMTVGQAPTDDGFPPQVKSM